MDNPELPTPSAAQLAWHDMELGMFIHFEPITFKSEPDYHRHPEELPAAETINPTALNTDQWLEAARAMGARWAVFTAQHDSGFCMWPTDVYDYGIKQSPWRQGKGDVVGDFVNSCHKYGIKPGLYCSFQPNFFLGFTSRQWAQDAETYRAYLRTYEQLITELCSRYGELVEMWFDGGFPTAEGEWRWGDGIYHGGPDVAPILAEHQPNMIVAQGPLSGCRWSGNEGGTTLYPCWSTLSHPLADRRLPRTERYDLLGHGDPDGEMWIPAECNTPLRTPHEWFWKPDGQELKSVRHLVGLYYQSVGRNSNLLLNATPNADGLIPDDDMACYVEFGTELRNRFRNCIAETSGSGEVLELALAQPATFDQVVIMEDITRGERIREYVVEGTLDHGGWFELCRGSSVGHKRVQVIPPFETKSVRLRCPKTVATPQIRRLALYLS